MSRTAALPSSSFVSVRDPISTICDQDISIQMRGGPETNMVTGWAQISSLEPGYSGVYHCIAENTQGKVHARAVVGVYRKEL